MQTYRCACGNRIYFENTSCLVCHREIGWCEACARMTSLEPSGDAAHSPPIIFLCGYSDCRQSLQKCYNYSVENICNRCYVPDALPTAQVDGANGAGNAVGRLCAACQLTETIPDLTVAGNREKWARLEAAKRRLLYTLDRLGLPYVNADPKLTFDFKADVEPPANEWRNAGLTELVYTGHAAGKITINIREADDAVREQLRCQFHEAHRTLIGHFHHEIGHYYWDVLVKNRQEEKFSKIFGDPNARPYQEAMSAYYKSGPPEGWAQSFISTYASAHPWEDFAETFALYLDMISILDSAMHLFRTGRINFRNRSIKPLVERYQEIGILVNEFNRAIGLIDLVPEVVLEPVVAKLEFIYSLVRRATRSNQIAQRSELNADCIFSRSDS
jgi:hypothetical protein